MPFIKNARFRTGISQGQYAGGYDALFAGTANAGTPGTAFGVGTLEKGAIVRSTEGTKLFMNSGTKAAPTWTKIAG